MKGFAESSHPLHRSSIQSSSQERSFHLELGLETNQNSFNGALVKYYLIIYLLPHWHYIICPVQACIASNPRAAQ